MITRFTNNRFFIQMMHRTNKRIRIFGIILLLLNFVLTALEVNAQITSTQTDGFYPYPGMEYQYIAEGTEYLDIVSSEWVIEPANAGYVSASGIYSNANWYGNENITSATLKFKYTHRVVNGTPIITDGSGQLIPDDGTIEVRAGEMSVVINLLRKVPPLVTVDGGYLPICKNASPLNLNSDFRIYQSKEGGYWTGQGIENGVSFNPQGLIVGNTYTVTYWINGQLEEDPTNLYRNKLQIKIIDSFQADEGSQTIPTGQSINLDQAKTWSGQGVSGSTFQSDQTGIYIISYQNGPNCTYGNKIIVVEPITPALDDIVIGGEAFPTCPNKDYQYSFSINNEILSREFISCQWQLMNTEKGGFQFNYSMFSNPQYAIYQNDGMKIIGGFYFPTIRWKEDFTGTATIKLICGFKHVEEDVLDGSGFVYYKEVIFTVTSNMKIPLNANVINGYTHNTKMVLPVCTGSSIDLNNDARIFKAKQGGYWTSDITGAITGKSILNASVLSLGNYYTLYYWESGKPSEDPCGLAYNKLTIYVVDKYFKSEDMEILTIDEANAGIKLPLYGWAAPLNSDYELANNITHYVFKSSKEGRYELPYSITNGCGTGKKTIIVKEPESLPVSSFTYTQTTNVLKDAVKDISVLNNLPIGEVSVQRVYVDGLGRPTQTIVKQASPDGNDIVSFEIYDILGRTPIKYMPFAQGTDGEWKTDVLSKQKDFYRNTLGIAHSAFPYSISVLENSSDGRLLESFASGESWAGTKGTAEEKKSTQSMRVNPPDYVRLLRPDASKTNRELAEGISVSANLILDTYDGNTKLFRATRQIELTDNFTTPDAVLEDIVFEIVDGNDTYKDNVFSANRYYPAGELMVTEATNEEGIRVREYKNKSGQVILKESQSDTQGDSFYQTYYSYDDFGKLRYVFPPKAVAMLKAGNWKMTPEILEISFYYEYDQRHRVVTTKIPHKGEVSTVYDQLDRPILSQNAVQRENGEWNFTKYDVLGRPVMGGVYHSSQTRQALQSMADQSSLVYEAKTTENAFRHYTNQAFPVLSATDIIETANYYDHYDFNGDGMADAGFDSQYNNVFTSSGFPSAIPFERIRGKATANFTRLDLPNGTFRWLRSVLFYDVKGRTIQTQTQNHLDSADVFTISFDFAGKMLSSYLDHRIKQGSTISTVRVQNETIYNHVGKPLKTFQTIQKDNEPAIPREQISEIRYNELGQVVEKKLGRDGANPLQTLDFGYNIRGWLEKFNDLSGFDNAPDKDLFAYTLSYENKGVLDYDQNLKWDGNISAMSWKSSLDGKQRGYDYRYDPLGRLGNANYHCGNGNEKYSEGNLGYDENGNILNLERDGLTSVGNYGQVDKLVYSYKGNQLLSVTDAAAATGIAGDFQDGNKTGNDYEYDLNGNLTRDRNKEIASIKYNSQNLPEQIIWENGDKIEYLYDKAGIKLRSSVFQHTSGEAYSLVRETDYSGSFVYEKNILSFMNMGEGRYVFKLEGVPSGGRTQGYEYHLKDHLGNLRVAFRKGEDITYTATMELENSTTEAREFDNVVNVRSNPGQGRSSNFAAKIDQSIPMGIWKTLKVGKGDRVDAEVWAKYTQDNTQNSGSGLGVYATTQVPNLSDDPDRQTGNSAPLLALGISYAPNQNPNNNSDVPRAYLIGILYDLEGNPVETHRVEISSNAKTGWEQLTKSITVSQAGQLQIFVANEGDVPVFFDDMEIKLSQNLIAQENHYYPFGMNLVGIEKEGRPNHRFQYNGKEKQEDFELDWMDYGARMYDGQIGRWFSIDPKASEMRRWSPYNYCFNNPLRFTDPDGMKPYDNYYIYSNGEIEREKTNDRSDSYYFVTKKTKNIDLPFGGKGSYISTIKDLIGTFEKIKNGKGNDVVRFSNEKSNKLGELFNMNYMNRANEPAQNYVDPEAAASIIGAGVNYKNKTGEKMQLHQLSTFYENHSNKPNTIISSEVGRTASSMVDVQYAHKECSVDGDGYRPGFFTYDAGFDKDGSKQMVDEYKRFGFSVIYTATYEGSQVPVWSDTVYSDGGHDHHFHADGYKSPVVDIKK